MTDDGCDVSDAGMNLVQVWLNFASKMVQAGASLPPPQAIPPGAVLEMRSAVLDACTRFWDQFLRSPQFLAMMQQSMTACINWRKQINDCLGELRHEFQEARCQETEQIMLAQRHREQRILDVVENLGTRLDEIAARLAAQGPAGSHEVLNGFSGNAPLKSDRKKSAANSRRRANPPNKGPRRTTVPAGP